jgi:glucoamylase
VEVAALLAAAEFADGMGESKSALYLRETADEWNDNIERWMYVVGSATARRVGVEGFYARIAPADHSAEAENIRIKNRGLDVAPVAYEALVSPDALALVRFGLRAADDPRIINTVRVIDALLRRETATGPVWHRYNGDGYGEHDDGAPFDGTGVGRGWPLLAGERAHYELAAGRPAEARRLLAVMHAQTNPGGLIPEQVWDAPDITSAGLFNGAPSGAAMPLAWAHAEYVKLMRSLSDGRVFDTSPQVLQRYRDGQRAVRHVTWSFGNKVMVIQAGKTLRIEITAPGRIHWSADGWRTTEDTAVMETGLDVWYADLPTESLPDGSVIRFTFYWLLPARWENVDFEVRISGS